MIRTTEDVNINVGGNRTESRTLLFMLGPAINGAYTQTDELVQFQIMILKKLTLVEIPLLTFMVGATQESEGVIKSKIEDTTAI